jgi:hypothetical protein
MNAKVELLSHINLNGRIKCAKIEYKDNPDPIILKVGYSNSENDLGLFLDKLDFDYDDGYGSQELFGIIWFENGTWSTRGEYDGSEWWEHNALPKIPKELL